MALSANAAEYEAEPGDGITIVQLDFPDKTPAEVDSSVAYMQVNLLRLRNVSGIATGYVNIVIDERWAVRNMIVPRESDYPYSHLATEFDLDVVPGTDVTMIDAYVLYSDDVQQQAPGGVATAFGVGSEFLDFGGESEGEGGNGSSKPPTVDDVLFGDPTNTRAIFQLDHPNVEAAVNQCSPMSVANSLQFLANTTDFDLPHSHVPGLKGDNSLVGQLDTYMDRTATSRTSGSGVNVKRGLEGKMQYLVENNLHERIQTRHWGISGDEDISFSKNGKTATSTAGGASLPIDELVNSLERGEDCEAGYYWDGGAHAIDIVGAGYTNGMPWIIEGSDIKQKDDTSGAGPQGFIFSHLTDPDKNGDLNLNGTDTEILRLFCQAYVPPPDEDETALPPPTGSFVMPGTGLVIDLLVDPSNHSCCVTPPPASVDLALVDGELTVSASGVSWLPISAELNGAAFSGTNVTEVAGYSNINNSISGSFNGSEITATITLGTGGGLPGGQPISWEVTMTPDEMFAWTGRMPMNTGVKPRLRVNGFRDLLVVDAGDPLSFNLSLDNGDMAASADYFLFAELMSGQIYNFSLDGQWTPGAAPIAAHQALLVDLPNTPLHQRMTGLGPGDYTFFFYVDTVQNGVLDIESSYLDTVTLIVQ